MKHILVTHTDMDGVGCYIALSQIVQFDKVITASYDLDKVKKELYNIDTSHFPFELTIWITDFNIAQDLLDSIRCKVMYFDHHQASENLIFKEGDFASIDLKQSGAKLCYDYICTEGKGKNISKLIGLINKYDMHKLDDDMTCVYLNELYWHLGFHNFYDIFKNGFTLENIIWIKRGKEIFEKQIENVKKEQFFVQGDICVSFEISTLLYYDFIFKNELNFYICVYRPLKVSFRSKFNLNPFYERLKQEFGDMIVSCGGHKGAGAATFNKKIDYDIIEKMVNIIEEVRSECYR